MERNLVVLGQETLVKDRIPYKEKMDAAEEFAALATVFNEELGIAYDSPLSDAVEKYILLKYYTGIDMSAYAEYDGLCQMMDDIGEYPIDDLGSVVQEDWRVLWDLCYQVRSSVEAAFEKEHSLAHRIQTSFGFLFEGKDLTQTLAEAREVNEQMIDHLGAIAQVKTQPIDMAQYAKKKK